MRKNLKFKVYKQLKSWKNLTHYPYKILNTSKESWKDITKNFKQKVKKNQRILSTFKKRRRLLRSSQKFLLNKYRFNSYSAFAYGKKLVHKLQRRYTYGLNLKRYYYLNFNFSIKNKQLKKQYLSSIHKTKHHPKLVYFLFFLKPLYKLNILLKNLHFCTSIYEVSNLAQQKQIILNNQTNGHLMQDLKLGDIIELKSHVKVIRAKRNKIKQILFLKQFYFFCEVDYYTKSIVITKNFSNSIFSENSQLYYQKFDIQNFISFLKREY